ncbi:hypothetical protein LR48_Vigan06g053800 [Vigna angularis]|uniref:Uncharacterized protein n=1 Tax=Phaseolus angularis TaxID=3914 RepID=A0A0L9URL0_PHAAN|nr:hypothetical protein LR48_Vigan06g053800 [Vigna angularis]
MDFSSIESILTGLASEIPRPRHCYSMITLRMNRRFSHNISLFGENDISVLMPGALFRFNIRVFYESTSLPVSLSSTLITSQTFFQEGSDFLRTLLSPLLSFRPFCTHIIQTIVNVTANQIREIFQIDAAAAASSSESQHQEVSLWIVINVTDNNMHAATQDPLRTVVASEEAIDTLLKKSTVPTHTDSTRRKESEQYNLDDGGPLMYSRPNWAQLLGLNYLASTDRPNLGINCSAIPWPHRYSVIPLPQLLDHSWLHSTQPNLPSSDWHQPLDLHSSTLAIRAYLGLNYLATHDLTINHGLTSTRPYLGHNCLTTHGLISTRQNLASTTRSSMASQSLGKTWPQVFDLNRLAIGVNFSGNHGLTGTRPYLGLNCLATHDLTSTRPNLASTVRLDLGLNCSVTHGFIAIRPYIGLNSSANYGLTSTRPNLALIVRPPKVNDRGSSPKESRLASSKVIDHGSSPKEFRLVSTQVDDCGSLPKESRSVSPKNTIMLGLGGLVYNTVFHTGVYRIVCHTGVYRTVCHTGVYRMVYHTSVYWTVCLETKHHPSRLPRSSIQVVLPSRPPKPSTQVVHLGHPSSQLSSTKKQHTASNIHTLLLVSTNNERNTTNSEEKGTHESYPGRANAKPGLGANPIESVAREEPLRNPPRHEAERGPEAKPFQAVTASLGALAEDEGDGVLHNHGGEREEEHGDNNEGIQSGLGLGEGEEPNQQALAREAAVQVRSAAAIATAVARPQQLPIERPRYR